MSKRYGNRNKARLILFGLMAVLLVIPIIYISILNNEEELFKLKSVLFLEDSEECIYGWNDEAGNLFFCVPEYMDMPKLKLRLKSETAVFVDKMRLSDGLSCEGFQFDVPYELTYEKQGKAYENTLIFVQSGNVPAMFIDTRSGNMNYIHTHKGNEEPGKVRLYAPDGALYYAGDVESLNGRGNNTWDAFEKKPYSLKLSEEADLLGMGKAQRWVLLANAGDPSHLRNKIVYDFAHEAGLVYSPDSRWVDLYLNGEYAGLYLLSERNEVHPERVDIEAAAQRQGFLVSLEREERLNTQNYAHVITDTGQALRIHYPANPSDEEMEKIGERCQSVENAILSAEGIDPGTQKSLPELIDMDSWAKKYLMEEIFGNFDGGWISQYFYYDPLTEKVFAGPVWDFDYALGNDFDQLWKIDNPNMLVVNRSLIGVVWFSTLYHNHAFYDRMLELYQTDFLPLLERFLEIDIPSYADEIRTAVVANDMRWRSEESMDWKAWVDQISSYLENHVKFLNQCWFEGMVYYEVAVRVGEGIGDLYYSVLPNECVSDFPQPDDTENFLGWYRIDTDEPFDPSVPITGDIEIYGKWVDSESKKIGQIIKLIPLTIIALLGVCLLTVEVWRGRKACNKP